MNSMRYRADNVPVLVVGGGLAGLSAAAFLAWRGVEILLVERRPGSSPHPRAVGFTTRTLELYRAIGLDTDIPQLELGSGRPRRVSMDCLTGTWSEEISWAAGKTPQPGEDERARPRIGYSPVTGASIAQDRLEPAVRAHAITLGAEIRLSTTLMEFDQDDKGITAIVRDPEGKDYTVRAQYMIAADGHASRIREALGIGRSGHGHMHVMRSVIFHAPEMLPYLEKGITQFEIHQPGFEGMLTTYGDTRWLLMIQDDEDRDEQQQLQMVHRALGRSDVDVEILTGGRWVLGAHVADSFQKGRIFLAGDAAHALPPARGGYGANTGIEDAFNIAWKLESVISGKSGPELLDTYDAERRPIAWLRHNQIFARPDYAAVATEEEKKVEVLEDDAMELGQLYRSAAIIGAGAHLSPARRPEQWAGQPGTRAQHLWVTIDGQRLSTIDILQRRWTILTGDTRWCDAVAMAGRETGIDVELLYFGDGAATCGNTLRYAAEENATLSLDRTIEQIVAEPEGRAAVERHIPPLMGHDNYHVFRTMTLRQLQPLSQGLITDNILADIEQNIRHVPFTAIPTDQVNFRREFEDRFGIGQSGASLIRPDGYVAWRVKDMPDGAGALLSQALRQVSFSLKHSLAKPRTEAHY